MQGKAYVNDTPSEQMVKEREPGVESEYAETIMLKNSVIVESDD